MFSHKSILVILLLSISQLVAAGGVHLNREHNGAAPGFQTNAKRMAHGLPPLPPKDLRGLYNHQTPTQPQNPTPSSTKPDCDNKQQVHIKCTDKNGGNVGYVCNDFSTKGKAGFGLTSSRNNALKVDFDNSVTPFDFKLSNPGSFPNLGFCGNDLKSGISDSAVLTSTHKTPQSAGPANVGNPFSSWSANSESQIWAYTRSSNSVTASWINSGGSPAPSPCFFYDPTDDLFHLVSDPGRFSQKYPKAYQVEFSIEDS